MTGAREILLFIFGLFYFLYTLSFAIHFNKTASIFFSKSLIRFHLIMIWVIPFLWILIIKALAMPGENKFHTKKKSSGSSNQLEDVGWVTSFYGFFHTSPTSYSNSSRDSDVYNGHGHDNQDFGGHLSDSTDLSSGHH